MKFAESIRSVKGLSQLVQIRFVEGSRLMLMTTLMFKGHTTERRLMVTAVEAQVDLIRDKGVEVVKFDTLW